MPKSWSQLHSFSDAQHWEGMPAWAVGLYAEDTACSARHSVGLCSGVCFPGKDVRARSNKTHCLQGNRTSGSADKWMCSEMGAGPTCLHRWISPLSFRPLQLGVFWCWPILHGSPDIPRQGVKWLSWTLWSLLGCALFCSSAPLKSWPATLLGAITSIFPLSGVLVHLHPWEGISEHQGSLSFTPSCPFLHSCLF